MKKSMWMWCPDAFERYHGMLVHNRRTVSGVYHPPMWRVDSPERNLFLYKVAVLDEPETITLHANTADASLVVAGKYYPAGVKVTVPSGKQMVKVSAYKETGFPAVYIEGDTFASDKTWSQASFGGGDFPAGTNEMYTELSDDPEKFKFSYKRIYPASSETVNGGILYDFGRESFGIIDISGISAPDAEFTFFCGESRDEAIDTECAVIRIFAKAENGAFRSGSVAFRYIFVPDLGGEYNICADFEYLPIEDTGAFSCEDKLINEIYYIAGYTLHLNTREGFLDGIKRDRWVWGGDAYQSALASYYLTSDKDTVRRTLNILHGAEPMNMHVNTIPDYTFYWIISIWEYYLYTGDAEFVRSFYRKIDSTMKFIEKRLGADGMYEKRRGDWVFVDWSSFDKDAGPMCAEQMLLCHAYFCASECAALAYDAENAEYYKKRFKDVYEKINSLYWDEEKNAFVDDYRTGNRNVTRHANIFALLYNLTTEERKAKITEHVIKNDDVQAITTPYFKFFELASMSEIGDYKYVANSLRDYWGGMIKLGATSFWEEYDPAKRGAEHYAMYGRPYDKSLCHAWGGTSPIYLLGRYILGVFPTSPGYATYEVKPCVTDIGFGKTEGTVPTPRGNIKVKIDEKSVTVISDMDGGTLVLGGKTYIIPENKALTVEIHD